MVGILIVSHSANAAAGAREIAVQMAGTELAIVACGGNSSGGIGTNPEAIAANLEVLLSDEGVIIIADLGSAVMSAEMILDTLSPERRAQVVIANAPLVEGTLMAAVEASMGKDLKQVVAAAESANQMCKVERSE
jgi:phosphoenolpyruvate---glycerone phosphotransferase subunit DhaM